MPSRTLKEPRRLLLYGIVLQFIILLALTGWAAHPLVRGETGLLRIIPVDPRDAFRGDYVTLGYEGIAPNWQYSEINGTTVYVPLTREADGKHWSPGPMTSKRPNSGTYLRGTRDSSGRVRFGIETFYVQNGTGSRYSDALRDRKLSAEITVSPEGQGTIRRLIMDR